MDDDYYNINIDYVINWFDMTLKQDQTFRCTGKTAKK